MPTRPWPSRLLLTLLTTALVLFLPLSTASLALIQQERSERRMLASRICAALVVVLAGAALLVKDAYPEWTPAALRDFVYSRARPLPADLNVSPGQVGYGRLDLGEAPSRLLGSEISIMAGRSNGDSTQFETIIAIVNATSITATANLTHPIPSGVTLTGSAAATLDPAPTVVNGAVTWQGDVPPDSVVEVRYSADGATMPEQPLRLRSTATLRDSDEVEIEISVFVNPLQVFLPLLTP